MKSVTEMIEKSAVESREEKRAREWEEQKASARQYFSSSKVKRDIIDEIVMQKKIEHQYKNDPPYLSSSSFNYVYVFTDKLDLIGRENV